MECPGCKAELQNASLPIRCLECGMLIPATPQPSPIAAAAKHSYQTPYGHLLAQVQCSGEWAARYSFAKGSTCTEKLRVLLGNLGASLKRIESLSLPTFLSFDQDKHGILWRLPRIDSLRPLSSLGLPLTPDEVRTLVDRLSKPLLQLHEIGLGAFDLAPETIFVAQQTGQMVLVPTPWLASLANWMPGQLADMPFTAPELGQKAHYPDVVRADLYGLGTLCWYLLIGTDRRQAPTMLPSEVSTALMSWDSFIDGCCRSNPARRFASVAQATQSLNGDGGAKIADRPPVQVAAPRVNAHPTCTLPVDQAAPVRKRRTRISRRAMTAATAAIGGVGVYMGWRGITFLFPALDSSLTPYKRGFGDTIRRYADRSYDGASWETIKEIDAITEVSDEGSFLHAVAGWDDDSYWLARKYGQLFQRHDGHWKPLGELSNGEYPVLRPLSPDTLLVAGSRGSKKHLYRVEPSGITDLGRLDFWSVHGTEICAVADDLIYCFNPDLAGLNAPIAKFANGQQTDLREDKHKEALVHRRDNTPLKEYPLRRIKHTCTPVANSAYGIVASEDWRPTPAKIVSFENGIWYAMDDLPNTPINDAWFCFSGTSLTAVVAVGDEWYVFVHRVGGPKLQRSVTESQEVTSTELVRVWGVSPDKFWVMDKNGTVWEYGTTSCRAVVRGLYRDDVAFKDSWVSPTGMVLAITDKQLYRLA